ncbi:hypothetical protein [Bacteroides sp. 51]|uniref:hypothetical protein n=1 Tax=Bacteroides sp. 51 TaxID=2302938 RepID=UPI0013D3809D|nr:hypothetical protein [Bacteroides sp. 51]NDV84109.1 hypothetical protein [Bacteroides sp. 51]
MKNIAILILLSLTMLSCSSDKNEESEVKETRTVMAVCQYQDVSKSEIIGTIGMNIQWTTISIEYVNDVPTRTIGVVPVWDTSKYSIESLSDPYKASSSMYRGTLSELISYQADIPSDINRFVPQYAITIMYYGGNGAYRIYF